MQGIPAILPRFSVLSAVFPRRSTEPSDQTEAAGTMSGGLTGGAYNGQTFFT